MLHSRRVLVVFDWLPGRFQIVKQPAVQQRDPCTDVEPVTRRWLVNAVAVGCTPHSIVSKRTCSLSRSLSFVRVVNDVGSTGSKNRISPKPTRFTTRPATLASSS